MHGSKRRREAHQTSRPSRAVLRLPPTLHALQARWETEPTEGPIWARRPILDFVTCHLWDACPRQTLCATASRGCGSELPTREDCSSSSGAQPVIHLLAGLREGECALPSAE